MQLTTAAPGAIGAGHQLLLTVSQFSQPSFTAFTQPSCRCRCRCLLVVAFLSLPLPSCKNGGKIWGKYGKTLVADFVGIGIGQPKNVVGRRQVAILPPSAGDQPYRVTGGGKSVEELNERIEFVRMF
jgi:hypothetical protein